jgi:hypothetical protein
MTFVAPPLDFDVVREVWNRYELADNAILKSRVILTEVIKTTLTNQASYSFDFHPVNVVLTRERGTPDNHSYSPQELQQAITREDVRYTTQSEEWNEYVSDDGARIRVKATVVRVSKTSRFNAKGEPIYFVESSTMVSVKPPAGQGGTTTTMPPTAP